MKHVLFSLILILVAIFINSAIITDRIADIIVEGNNYTSSEYILSKSELTVGQALYDNDIQRAIKKLFDTGMFESIDMDMEKRDIGNVLIIKVKEYRRIKNIIFKGNKKKKKKEILENITVNEGDFASDYNLYTLLNEIENFYIEKGFLNIQINYEIKELKDNSVNIILNIDENEKIRIKHIEIYGNYKVTDKKIKSEMKTKEKSLLKDGIFKEEDFEQDKQTIVKLVQETGYPDAKIDSIVKTISYDKKWLYINIYVNPGDRYKFGNIEITGNKDIKTKTLEKFINIEKGEFFNKTKFDNILSAMYQLYMDRGYIFLQIIPDEKRTGNEIDYTLNITENLPAKVRFINISGNELTEENVIRREILTLPGSIFNRSELVVSHSNLFRLGYFEDVQINPVPIKELSMVDIDFTVKEKKTGEFNIGASYNEVDKFSGNIKVGVNNLLGKGMSANLQFDMGPNILNFISGFSNPYFTGRPILAGFDLYYYTKDRIFYNDNRMGFVLKTGSYISRKLSTKFYISYKLEKVKLYTEDSLAFDAFDPWLQEQVELEDSINPATGKYISQISPSIVRDTRSHYFFPEKGQMIGIYTDFAGGYLSGQVDFKKLRIDTRFYQKLGWKFVLMSRFTGGVVDGYSDPNTVPLTERFVLGGVGTWGLRGYFDRSIGPKSGGYTIGGRMALLSNIELRMKINEQAFLLAFFDIGNAWENYTDAKNENFWPMYYGTGLGVRLEIPMMGIIGIDLGYGFDEVEGGGGGKWEPHFQMGTSF